MQKRKTAIWIPVTALGLLLAAFVFGQTGGGYDLSWWTVDGGGGEISGGGYTLYGVAGQPDANIMMDASDEIEGGFLQSISGPITPNSAHNWTNYD